MKKQIVSVFISCPTGKKYDICITRKSNRKNGKKVKRWYRDVSARRDFIIRQFSNLTSSCKFKTSAHLGVYPTLWIDRVA